MKRATVALLAVLAACGGPTGPSAGTQVEIRGSVTVMARSVSDLRSVTPREIEQRSACTGSQLGAGYSDVAAGAGVVVKDQAGTIIGTGQLDGGTWDSASCRFPFVVTVAPAEFYQVDVSHRGGGTISRADVDAGKPLNMTLG